MTLTKNIEIPDNVYLEIKDGLCLFSGSKGSITYKLHNFIIAELNNKILSLCVSKSFFRKRDLVSLTAIFNTTFVMLKNCIIGVSKFFEYSLVLKGVGYKAAYDSKNANLTILLGYSHPVIINVPKDIFVEVPINSEIIIKSASKAKAGQFASDIRFLKLPEIYKGNGIRYKNENVVLKIPKKTK